MEADGLLEELEEQNLREQNQKEMANKWRSDATRQLQLQDMETDIISPAKSQGPPVRPYSRIIKNNNKENRNETTDDLNEDFWNDTTPRELKKKYIENYTRKPFESRQNRIKRAETEQSLKSEIKSAVDGTYLPTPRANGGIWKSTKLPPKKILLNEMFDDTKFLLEWIKSGQRGFPYSYPLIILPLFSIFSIKSDNVLHVYYPY